ncbi:MAG: transposase [Flavobacteriales bacterium Tduv]
MIHLEVYGKRNKQNISKRSGNKKQATYSGISLFKMMLLIHCYHSSDVGTEELVKYSIGCMYFCGFRSGRSDPISYDFIQISK